MGMGKRLLKIRKTINKKLIKVLTKKQIAEQFAQWEKLYGDFDKSDYENYTIKNLPSESGFCHGEIIKWAAGLNPERVILAGENKTTASILQEKINANEVYTTGLSDVDYQWDFDEDIPAIEGYFNLVITQAILEHIINPYKHIQDLISLLQINGHLILHTVIPGFPYHRYPIDAVRFFPDWFEKVAERLKLTIVKKKIRETHIFYMYKKS